MKGEGLGGGERLMEVGNGGAHTGEGERALETRECTKCVYIHICMYVHTCLY